VICIFLIEVTTGSNNFHHTSVRNRDNSVCIATKLPTERPSNRNLIPGTGNRYFSIPEFPDRLWGPHSLLSTITGGSLPTVKRVKREVDLSPPSSTEVRNAWGYASTPTYI
jgi:hypothetical protein